jgi:MFS family permease
MLINPPAGYVPEGSAPTGSGPVKATQTNFLPSEMLKTGAFYRIWLLYFIGSGAGLMVIGSVASMAKKSMGDMAFIAVAIMAIGNAGGRIIAGILSDKIGRKATLIIMLLFQAILMFVAIPVISSGGSNAVLIVIIATFIGFNYGTNLSLFPSLTKDIWGLKNFGINYGIVFTAWGVGGFVMGRLSQMLQASSGSYNSSFITAGILLIIAVIVALTLKSEKQH